MGIGIVVYSITLLSYIIRHHFFLHHDLGFFGDENWIEVR